MELDLTLPRGLYTDMDVSAMRSVASDYDSPANLIEALSRARSFACAKIHERPGSPVPFRCPTRLTNAACAHWEEKGGNTGSLLIAANALALNWGTISREDFLEYRNHLYRIHAWLVYLDQQASYLYASDTPPADEKFDSIRQQESSLGQEALVIRDQLVSALKALCEK